MGMDERGRRPSLEKSDNPPKTHNKVTHGAYRLEKKPSKGFTLRGGLELKSEVRKRKISGSETHHSCRICHMGMGENKHGMTQGSIKKAGHKTWSLETPPR